MREAVTSTPLTFDGIVETFRGVSNLSQVEIQLNKPGSLPQASDDGRYTRTLIGGLARSALSAAPPHWREVAAESWFRRRGAPGPANEHVFQYLLCKRARGEAAQEQPETSGLKGADLFYERQYRQYMNTTMGAYATTATLALLACGGQCQGYLWGKHRKVHAAMVEEAGGGSPVIILDRQTAAVPLLLPAPANDETVANIDLWLSGRQEMPRSYGKLVAGEKLRCATPGARARRRSALGALIELAGNIRHTGKLAILAFHQHDPDAMGLHITIFGTQVVPAETLEADYGLEEGFLKPWRQAAAEQNSVLRFCVGGTEELFAHCSLNLFVKRRASSPGEAAREAWSPTQPLKDLLPNQFELFQATVSASGLPGISPRNGDTGKTGFLVRQGLGTRILIPYFTGNFIHGHAAKVWSNPQGVLMIRDDHTALSFVVLRGKARVARHDWVAKNFPYVAAVAETRRKQSGERAPAPEYWFVHQVSEILQQGEPLVANELDPVRPPCTIHAAGPAHYGKKAHYFETANLPCYDQHQQHEREAAGRPVDPSGDAHRQWEREMAPALAARLTHLENTGAAAGRSQVPEEQAAQ